MSFVQLELPPELLGVPFNVLRDFLSQFSKLLLSQIAPNIPDQLVQASVTDLLNTVGTAPAPVDVRLEFKHICKRTGCTLDDCQLCRNNPSKVCGDNDCFDHQYWVRDDGKGGQLIKAKCGADVALQLIDKATNTPVYLPDIKIVLYVVNGQMLASSSPAESANGLYLSDDGHPLFAAAGAALEVDRGVLMELSPDERLGPVAHIPEFQFLNKNSKFKVGGRTFKCFKLLARAIKKDSVTGQELVLAQVESESFKVTTKKGYDGCRKAEYLYAHDPITDKTFANLGETTISNLKASFEGIETVEDLMHLVQACRSQPDMEQRLREVLNMARDAEKWRNLTRMLTDKVVWDDNIPRIFVVPNAARPLGLLFRANKGQVDFSNPMGVLVRPPAATGQLRVTKLSDRLQTQASRQLEALRSLATAYWRIPRHPGWALAPESPCWEDAAAPDIIDAFTELFGVGDPASLAEMHVAAYAQMAAAAAASPFLQRSPHHSGVSVTPPPGGVISPAATVGLGHGVLAAQGSINPAGIDGLNPGGHAAVGGIGVWGTGAGLPVVVTPEDVAAAAAAATGNGSTGPAQMAISGGTVPSPGIGRGISGGHDSGDSRDNLAAAVAAAAAGFGRLGAPSGHMPHNMSVPTHMGQANVITTHTNNQLAATYSGPMSAPSLGGSGLSLPTLLNPCQVGIPDQGFTAQQQQQQHMVQGPNSGPSPFVVPAGMRGSSSAGGSSGPAAMAAAAAGLPAGLSAGMTLGPPPPPQQQQQPQMGVYAGGKNLGSAGMAAGYQPGSATAVMQPTSSNMAAALGSAGAAAAAAAAMQVQMQMQGGGAYQGPVNLPGTYDLHQQQQQQQHHQQLAQHHQLIQHHHHHHHHQLQQQQQQQQQQLLVNGPLTPGVGSPIAVGAGTASGGHGSNSGTPSAALDPQQQQQQLQQQSSSQNTMLLQRAIAEGWSAPLVKAVLDRMSDEELRALVAQQPVTAAGVLARATGAYGQGLVMGQNHLGHEAQGLGHTVQSGVQIPDQQQMNPAAAAAGGVGFGAAQGAVTGALAKPQAGSQQQQQQLPQNGDTGAAAAAALAALFSDTAGGTAAAAAAPPGGALAPTRESFDVQLAMDQHNSLNLGLDSFSDHGQWGDLLENLRALSSSSGPRGDTGGGGNSILSTDWIPDLLFRLESESQRARDIGSVTAQSAGEVAQTTTAVQYAAAAAAAAAAAVGDDVDDGDRGAVRKAKRERSKTGQAPTAEQLAQLQALVAHDPSMLRSLSKGQSHYGSFNRHFPIARTSSRVESVAQGAQVANPWQPGLPMSEAGVPISPDHEKQQQPTLAAAAAAATAAVAIPGRAAVTTEVQAAAALGSRVISAGPHLAAAAAGGGGHAVCERISEEGAAAVAAVTGLAQQLPPIEGPNGGPLTENPSSELLQVLGLLQEDGSLAGYNPHLEKLGAAAAAAAADDADDALVNNVSGTMAAAAAADLASPFGSSQPQGVDAAAAAGAAAFLHPPQRTNSGRTGWISSLFRSSGSRSSKSSKSSSLKGSISVPVGSGGSHSSRDASAGLAGNGPN